MTSFGSQLGLTGFTAETRAKALAARVKNAVDRANSPLRKDFRDANDWDDLAHARHVRLAPWGVAPTPGKMMVFLRRCGATTEDYLDWAGEEKLSEFKRANPLWPLRAWQGIVLENIDSDIIGSSKMALPA